MKRIVSIEIVMMIGMLMMSVFLIGCMDDYHDGDREGDVTIMSFDVGDGANRDAYRGCFFTIRAKQNVNIDPSKYFFYVTEQGHIPKALEFGFRDCQDQGEDDLTPVGGDRNKSYRYDDKNWKVENMNVEATGQMWSDGEYIGFDMPKKDMGIDIEEGKRYEVMIKDPSNIVVYQGAFVYTQFIGI
ncbi:MAG: hypothetical protein QF682_04640 [Candidatus Thermoplasmatota archaeon]|jgi:hypothetical protein|nr:hypothetical protein [Candidatus Thermoplasmatota archaeon]